MIESKYFAGAKGQQWIQKAVHFKNNRWTSSPCKLHYGNHETATAMLQQSATSWWTGLWLECWTHYLLHRKTCPPAQALSKLSAVSPGMLIDHAINCRMHWTKHKVQKQQMINIEISTSVLLSQAVLHANLTGLPFSKNSCEDTASQGFLRESLACTSFHWKRHSHIPMPPTGLPLAKVLNTFPEEILASAFGALTMKKYSCFVGLMT